MMNIEAIATKTNKQGRFMGKVKIDLDPRLFELDVLWHKRAGSTLYKWTYDGSYLRLELGSRWVDGRTSDNLPGVARNYARRKMRELLMSVDKEVCFRYLVEKGVIKSNVFRKEEQAKKAYKVLRKFYKEMQMQKDIIFQAL